MTKVILLVLSLVAAWYNTRQKYNYYTTLLWMLLMIDFLALIQDQYITAIVLLAGFFFTAQRIKNYDPSNDAIYKAINDLDKEFRSKKYNGPSGGGMA